MASRASTLCRRIAVCTAILPIYFDDFAINIAPTRFRREQPRDDRMRPYARRLELLPALLMVRRRLALSSLPSFADSTLPFGRGRLRAPRHSDISAVAPRLSD